MLYNLDDIKNLFELNLKLNIMTNFYFIDLSGNIFGVQNEDGELYFFHDPQAGGSKGHIIWTPLHQIESSREKQFKMVDIEYVINELW